jgi:hypothetical protein
MKLNKSTVKVNIVNPDPDPGQHSGLILIRTILIQTIQISISFNQLKLKNEKQLVLCILTQRILLMFCPFKQFKMNLVFITCLNAAYFDVNFLTILLLLINCIKVFRSSIY